MENLKKERVTELFLRRDKRGVKVLTVFRDNKNFCDAINTEIGFELLKDLTAQEDNLLMKIADNKASEKEKVKYEVIKELINTWSIRVKTTENLAKKINEGKI